MARTMEQIEAEQEDDAEGAPRGRRLLMALLAGVGVLIVGSVAYWLLLGPSDGEEAADEPPEEGPVVEIAELTANLAGEDLRYVRVSMAVVLQEGVEVPVVERRFPILKDAALGELTAMSADDLRSSGGLDDFRTRMTEHAQDAYPDGEVLRVLITEMVVQ